MNKYTIKFSLTFVTMTVFVLFFNQVSYYTGEMIPFIGILLFGLLSLLFVVLRGYEWYMDDLAKRTLKELNKIESQENN